MHNKTPFLDGSPRTLFGRAKISNQVRFERRARELRDRSPGELSAQFSSVLPALSVARASENRRRRIFTHELTFWRFLGQVLGEDGSCAWAVAKIQRWCREHGLREPTEDTSSRCKARRRLPQSMLGRLHGELCACLDREMSGDLLWRGHVVKAIDGTSGQLPDTTDNQRAYPQHSGQKQGCGFPVMQLAGLINLCHGGWEQIVTSDINHHDHRLLDRVLPSIGRGEVLVADRAALWFP